MLHLKWKGGSGGSRGKSDYPGAKGDMGVPSHARVGKASVGKGSDYPNKKGHKGVDLPKGAKGSSAKGAARGSE